MEKATLAQKLVDESITLKQLLEETRQETLKEAELKQKAELDQIQALK